MSAFEAPVLGIPVGIDGPAAVVDVAESSFGQWRELARFPELVERQGVTVSITVDPGLRGAGDASRGDPVGYHKVGARRLELAGSWCEGWADAELREARARVGPELLAATEQFRYLVLEAAVLFLLTGPNRFPVHASAIITRGEALLLAGSSGVGKSTLAWLAAGAGWEVLSDDIVYVQQDPRWRVWGGGSAQSWFAADAHRHIPALAERTAELRANGEAKRSLGRTLPMPPVTERVALCLLQRGTEPRVAPVSEADALALMLGAPEPGFDVFPEAAAAGLRPLAARAVRLTLGQDPGAALPFLEEIRASFFA